MYEWNKVYAITKFIAALNAIYLLSLIILTNLISICWITLHFLGFSYKSFSPSLYLIIFLSLSFILILFLRISFVKGEKYLLISKRITKENPCLFGITGKWLTLGYEFFSILIFIIAAIVYIKN